MIHAYTVSPTNVKRAENLIKGTCHENCPWDSVKLMQAKKSHRGGSLLYSYILYIWKLIMQVLGDVLDYSSQIIKKMLLLQ